MFENVYKLDGLYSESIAEIIKWLNEAIRYAENDKQAAALRYLVSYYETGDLEKWSLYNINWVQDTEGDVDYINGFVEVYNDPLGYTGSYETIVEIKDFDASERMSTLMDNAQWFEDHMPFYPEHKARGGWDYLQRRECRGRGGRCFPKHAHWGQSSQQQLDPSSAWVQIGISRQHRQCVRSSVWLRHAGGICA